MRVDIMTMRHGDGWKAYLADNPGVWEAGKTDVEALGKLLVSAAGMLSVSIHRSDFNPIARGRNWRENGNLTNRRVSNRR